MLPDFVANTVKKALNKINPKKQYPIDVISLAHELGFEVKGRMQVSEYEFVGGLIEKPMDQVPEHFLASMKASEKEKIKKPKRLKVRDLNNEVKLVDQKLRVILFNGSGSPQRARYMILWLLLGYISGHLSEELTKGEGTLSIGLEDFERRCNSYKNKAINLATLYYLVPPEALIEKMAQSKSDLVKVANFFGVSERAVVQMLKLTGASQQISEVGQWVCEVKEKIHNQSKKLQ